MDVHGGAILYYGNASRDSSQPVLAEKLTIIQRDARHWQSEVASSVALPCERVGGLLMLLKGG